VGGKPLPRLRTRKGYLLLALLALRQGGGFSRDVLIGTLWPESDQEAGALSLRRALHDLRAALGEAEVALEAPDRRHLRLVPEHVWVDVWELKALLRHGVVDTEAVVALYQGTLLPGFDEPVLLPERQQLQEAVVQAVLRAGEQALERGEAAIAVLRARQAIAHDPFAEPLQRLLYRALARAGDPTAARRAYREFRVRLYEELRQEPSPETRQCLENLPRPVPIPVTTPDTLPHFLSTFLGRERELTLVTERLRAGQVVTLLGPGGVGKTRLAVEVARSHPSAFPQGTFFVDLSTVPAGVSESLLWQALERAIGAEGGEGTASEVVLRLLRGRLCLLLLDNAEHVPALRALVMTLLKVAPTLTILVTSRAPLGVLGEAVVTVAPLPTPQGEGLGAVLASEAALLFVQRVQTLRPEFALNVHNAAEVAQLCRCLDGLPLALELAAARLRHLSMRDLVARLGDPLPLLVGGEGHPERQRTLEQLLAGSYDPLPRAAQQVLDALSLFPDTFSLAAAEALCGSGDTLLSLGRLVDASLVQVSEDLSGTTRYRLLEIIRAFAAQKLEKSGGRERAQERLGHWAVAFLSEAYAGLWGSEGGRWLERIGQELANLEAALLGAEAEEALRITHLLEQFWWRTNRLREGILWFDRALAKDGGTEAARGDSELGREQFLNLLGEPNQVVGALEAAVVRAQQRADPESAFYLLHTLGLILAKRRCYSEAVDHLQAVWALAPTLGDPFYRAYAELGLLEVLLEAGQLAQARTFGESALASFAAQGRVAHVIQVQLQLGRVALAERRFAEATALLTQGWEGAQSGGMRDVGQELLLALGETAEAAGNREDARAWYTLLIEQGEVGGQRGPLERAQQALLRVV